MATFTIKFGNKILKLEGEHFVPDDNGRGPCRYGLTAKTLKNLGYRYDDEFIRDMKPEFARHVYETDFWFALGLDKVNNQALAEALCIAIIHLWNEPVEFIQEILNEKARAFLKVDGVLGTLTRAAINSYTCQEELYYLWKAAMAKHYQTIGGPLARGFLGRLKAS